MATLNESAISSKLNCSGELQAFERHMRHLERTMLVSRVTEMAELESEMDRFRQQLFDNTIDNSMAQCGITMWVDFRGITIGGFLVG